MAGTLVGLGKAESASVPKKNVQFHAIMKILQINNKPRLMDLCTVVPAQCESVFSSADSFTLCSSF